MVLGRIGHPRTRMPWGARTEDGKILRVNMAKGRIGQENAQFIGSMVLSSVLQAAFRRGEMPAAPVMQHEATAVASAPEQHAELTYFPEAKPTPAPEPVAMSEALAPREPPRAEAPQPMDPPAERPNAYPHLTTASLAPG